MPENINLDAVRQSITEFWLPTFGFIAVVIVAIIVIHIIRKKKNK